MRTIDALAASAALLAVLAFSQMAGQQASPDEIANALKTAMAQYGLSDEVLPMAVVDGVVYRGANELNEKLPPEALRWGGGTLSQVVYLYTPACESCARAEAALEALPKCMTVTRGGFSFESEVQVTRYDVTKESALAISLFNAYDVPEEKRVTPTVFLPGRALTGIDFSDPDQNAAFRAPGGAHEAVCERLVAEVCRHLAEED